MNLIKILKMPRTQERENLMPLFQFTSLVILKWFSNITTSKIKGNFMRSTSQSSVIKGYKISLRRAF